MGNSCNTCSSHIKSTPIMLNIKDNSFNDDNIIKIQNRFRQHLALKKTKTRIKAEIIYFIANLPYLKVTKKEIEIIRWTQLINIENNFNKTYGKYIQLNATTSSSFSSSSSSFNNNTLKNDNNSINGQSNNLFVFSMPPVLYQSLIYEGQWKYDSESNTFMPYGIGSIVKQTGLKIESYFKELEPIASISRIYYPNGRIYQGKIKQISSQYLPHGKGQIYLSTGIFEMNFDKGLPIGIFTFESSNNDYSVKGAFTQFKMNKDIVITYSNGVKYKGPFNYDNKNFTMKEIKNKDQIKEKKYILIHNALFSYLNYNDIAVLQLIPNKIIQNKIKDNCFNIKLNHFINNNHQLKQLFNAYHCKIKNVEHLVKHINNQTFIPLSAYFTNGGIIDYDTHYANIFNPSDQKVYFSNFYFDKTRRTSNVIIKGLFNQIIYDDIKLGNKTSIASLYNSFQERYTIDYYNSDVFDSNVYDALTAIKKKIYYFSINEIRIKIDITPNSFIVLTNPVKSFAVFITKNSFSKDEEKESKVENEQKDIMIIEEEAQSKWKQYINDNDDIKPINYFDKEECTIVEFDSLNKKGLLLFVEMKKYNTEIVYLCKDKMRHIGKEIKIVLFDQQVSIANAVKCGIDFGTIQFKGNIIEMIKEPK